MGCMFASCGHTVVTTAARADRAAMIESSAGPCGCIVATTALGCRRQMCRMLASRSEAVMACAAGTGYASVVETGSKPGVGTMASITFRRCLWMCRMFASG